LAAASLPSVGTINRFRRDLDTLGQEIQRERDRLAAAEESVAAAESKLRELTSDRPVLSSEVIAEKRRQREEDWAALRSTLFSSAHALTGLPLAERVSSFERNTTEADRLADSATSDATRIAAHAVETRRLAEERTRASAAQKQLSALDYKHTEVLKSWEAIWSPAGIAPLLPTEMAGWHLEVMALFERRERLETLRQEVVSLDEAGRRIRPTLQALAEQAGLTGIELADVTSVASQLELRLRSIGDSWEKALDADARMRDTRHRIENLVAREAELARKLDDWSLRWNRALSAIGIPVTTTREQAEAALAVWDKVPTIVRERDNRARRVAGMQRNICNFEDSAAELLSTIAPQLAALPADGAVKSLNDRLTEARAAKTRKAESKRHLAETAGDREEAEAALARAEAALNSLTAKLPENVDLADLSRRLIERDKLRDALRDYRTQLTSQSDGHDESQVRAELVDFDPDEAESGLQLLADEEQALESESQQVFAAHDQAIRERAAALDGPIRRSHPPSTVQSIPVSRGVAFIDHPRFGLHSRSPPARPVSQPTGFPRCPTSRGVTGRWVAVAPCTGISLLFMLACYDFDISGTNFFGPRVGGARSRSGDRRRDFQGP
jgi:hypothetical protein